MTTPAWRLPLMVTCLLAAVGLFALQQNAGGGLSALPMQDYVEYWAAGRLLARGDNPYDEPAIKELEAAAGRTEDPILMWNPPWVLPLVVPLGWVEARTGHLPWLGVQLLALLASAGLLARVYRIDPDRRLVVVALLFTFVPACAALIAGQISPLMLLGVAGFLALVQQRRDLLAGVAASLIGIKPHLALLFWIALVVWTLRTRRWGVIVGGILAGLALTGIAMAHRPGVVAEYFQTLRGSPPSQYHSPTLGMVLRLLFDEERFSLQFVPVVPGIAWLVWFGMRHRHDWDWGRHLPAVLLGSMLTAAYGAWLFDLTVLFVVVARIAGVFRVPCSVFREGGGSKASSSLSASSSPFRGGGWRVGLAFHVALNAIALVQLCVGGAYLSFIWITPALIAANLLFADRRSSPNSPDRVTDKPSPA
jgi:Glycosyltransferase family 87